MAAFFRNSPIRAIFILAIFGTTAPIATAQALIIQGRELAENNCVRCHAIDGHDESANANAPPFRTLSERYPVTDLAEALAEGIIAGHPDMPEFIFEPGEIEAFMLYLQSIQPKASNKF